MPVPSEYTNARVPAEPLDHPTTCPVALMPHATLL
jgi:hypothetical protein